MSKRMYEDLKEILCHELNEITRKGDIDREGLDDVYKLSSAITMIKSLMKDGQQGDQEQGEYSQRYSNDGMSNRMNPMHWSYEGGGSNDYSRNRSYDGMSNERGVTDGRDAGRDSRASNRMYSREDMSTDYSQRRGRDANTGRYVSRDSYDSYDGSYDGSYERGYSRHDAEQKVVQKLQDILATTKDTHIRKAIMQAMDRIDG